MAWPGLPVALPMAKKAKQRCRIHPDIRPGQSKAAVPGPCANRPRPTAPHPPCRAVGGAWSGFLTPVAPDAGRPAGLMPKATAFAGRAAGPVRPLRRQCRI